MLTTNLEDSKRLRELGAPLEAAFCWNKPNGESGFYLHFNAETPYEFGDEWYPCYTLYELISWLVKRRKDGFLMQVTGPSEYTIEFMVGDVRHEAVRRTAIDTLFYMATKRKGQPS